MITDADVARLKEDFKETFVTKEYLHEELKKYATQESLDALALKVDGIQEELGDLKVEVGEIHDKVDGLDVKFDAMLSLLTDTMQENRAHIFLCQRHDRQIHALAMATGTDFPD